MITFYWAHIHNFSIEQLYALLFEDTGFCHTMVGFY